MAKYNLTELSDEQGRPFLKMSIYSIRILSVEKKNWKRGTDMIVARCEIVAPETIEGVGKIAGLQLFERFVMDGDSDIPRKRMKALLKALKLPTDIDTDNEAQLKQLIGKAVKVKLVTKSVALKDDTDSPVCDDSGKPLSDNSYNILQYIGADEANTIPAENVAY